MNSNTPRSESATHSDGLYGMGMFVAPFLVPRSVGWYAVPFPKFPGIIPVNVGVGAEKMHGNRVVVDPEPTPKAAVAD